MAEQYYLSRNSVLLLIGLVACIGQLKVHAEDGSIRFEIEGEEGDNLPCRVHLLDSTGKPFAPSGLPFWHDHFVCPGTAVVETSTGDYRWEIERGPEYERQSGMVNADAGEERLVEVTLRRICNLRTEGWRSGDMHVHRPVTEIKHLMRAEDLDFAPVIGWWNTPAPNAKPVDQTEFRFDGHRVYTTGAGEDERQGGALLFFGLKQPLDLTVKSREFPSPLHFVEQARNRDDNVWIDIEKSFWWDVPTWLATERMDSIGIAHNHMHRAGVLDNEAWGKSRDTKRFGSVKGNGLWTQQIYYHVLNSGLRLPPSAGSASGVLPNPVGHNRVYVQMEQNGFNRDNWFAALKAGKCFVTNGPLLRVEANGSWPGTTFREKNDPLTVDLRVTLTSNDRVAELEVISNGHIIKRIPCANEVNQEISTTVKIAEPGWFLVRAIADVDNTFRFASTAPWYVERNAQETRISRASVQFFLDWVNERIEQVNSKVSDPIQRDSIVRWHIQAREFWLKQKREANAE